MSIVKRQDLEKKELRVEQINVPEFGGDVVIKELTIEQRVKCYQASIENRVSDPLKFTVAVFIEGVIEPKYEPKDIDAVKKLSGAGVERVTNRILKISGLAGDDAKNV